MPDRALLESRPRPRNVVDELSSRVVAAVGVWYTMEKAMCALAGNFLCLWGKVALGWLPFVSNSNSNAHQTSLNILGPLCVSLLLRVHRFRFVVSSSPVQQQKSWKPEILPQTSSSGFRCVFATGARKWHFQTHHGGHGTTVACTGSTPSARDTKHRTCRAYQLR